MSKKINVLTKICTVFLAIFTFNAVTNAETSNVVAKINDTSYSSLKEAIAAASEGDTITLISDTTENSVMSINAGITIEGNNHKINYNGTDAAFLINTSTKTAINNINLEAPKRGVAINNPTHNFTLTNSNLLVGERGVTVNTDSNKNSSLNITDCIIKKLGVNDYEKEVPNDGSRGISLWQYQDTTITLKNTTVEGFAYVINSASQVSFKGTKLIIDNCILRGRAGVNIWDSDFEIEVKNSEILGINNEKGPYETFANIVLNGSARNIKLNITDTKFLNYQNETGMNNQNGLQYMLSVRSINNTISISGNTSFIDSTNKLKDVLYYGIDNSTNIDNPDLLVTENNLKITGGTYSYDVTEFVSDGYESKKKDNLFVVMEKEYDREVKVENNITDIKVKLDNEAISKTLIEELKKTSEVDITKKDIDVALNIKDITPNAEIKNKISEKIKNGTIANYFDVSINVIDKSTNTIIGNLTELNNKITLSIEIPDSLKAKEGYIRKYYILREHNGVIEVLDTKNENGTLTFETDKFSTYALAYTEMKEEKPKDEIENPATEDKLKYNVLLMSCSIVAIGGIIYLGKKEEIF